MEQLDAGVAGAEAETRALREAAAGRQQELADDARALAAAFEAAAQQRAEQLCATVQEELQARAPALSNALTLRRHQVLEGPAAVDVVVDV